MNKHRSETGNRKFMMNWLFRSTYCLAKGQNIKQCIYYSVSSDYRRYSDHKYTVNKSLLKQNFDPL